MLGKDIKVCLSTKLYKFCGESYLFDYAGCLYPEGITPETIFYFNEENIDEVIFEGYKDEQEERWQRLYKNWIEENKKTYKKGVVSEIV